jgi:hypothetical protein
MPIIAAIELHTQIACKVFHNPHTVETIKGCNQGTPILSLDNKLLDIIR